MDNKTPKIEKVCLLVGIFQRNIDKWIGNSSLWENEILQQMGEKSQNSKYKHEQKTFIAS
jgi:hypothetical protein